MIISLQNEQVKHVVSLHHNKGRKDSGEYLIEGKRFVNEAFLRKASIKKIYYMLPIIQDKTVEAAGLVELAVSLGIPAEEVSENVMKKMSATEEPQGILAIVNKIKFFWSDIRTEDHSLILIVDGVQDPGNLGTILRTALAADVKQVILTKGTVDPYNPKVLRSTMGAIFSQIILTEKTPEEVVNYCSDQHITLAVSTMAGDTIFGEKTCDNYPLALVIGNEAFGPSEYFLKKAIKKYSIPMFNNVESLNVAMAAGIFLYELRRQVRFL
ncbi:MAG: 23S rRNA (adenosine(1067)-2'-O)-methyltransferase [Candidatus Dichloromethanomonas elyunquensis]|nr:MAG: 23S rRNA (adenosine(1067)-2'-O)-methyltransferase [Candidatus Dichloromethanomonas elyunquensis]